MRLPFTQQEFLDVFGAYNSTAWPVVIALWVVTFAFGVRFVRGQARSVTTYRELKAARELSRDAKDAEYRIPCPD